MWLNITYRKLAHDIISTNMGGMDYILFIAVFFCEKFEHLKILGSECGSYS